MMGVLGGWGGEGGEEENQWSRARATSQIQSHSATPC